jgi:hypothetical protein
LGFSFEASNLIMFPTNCGSITAIGAMGSEDAEDVCVGGDGDAGADEGGRRDTADGVRGDKGTANAEGDPCGANEGGAADGEEGRLARGDNATDANMRSTDFAVSASAFNESSTT